MTDLAAATAILADLVAMPTVSSASNLEAVAYCRDRLAALGARLSVTPDPTGTKANLFATLGPDVDGGVILSGHLDVVPVAGQPWTRPPFALTAEGGRLYGRGTCDMKGFIACALATAPAFAAAPLRRPLHIALTHDEEVGCLGAPALLADLVASGRRPGACLVGEPTEMAIVTGHKGSFEYTTRFVGRAGHASRPDLCVNAVDAAARFVAELGGIAADLRAAPPLGSRFDPPWTTVSVGRIAGGIARNVVPDACEIDWEIRPVTLADAACVKARLARFVAEAVLPGMRAVDAGAGVETETIAEVPGLAPDPASAALDLARRLTGSTATDLVAFGTEAGLFQAAGIPTVVCGPGSIAQAHRPDEFIEASELVRCLGMLARLRDELAA